MDLNGKSKPNLISSKTLKNIDKIFKSDIKTIQNDWKHNLLLFYYDYIKPNLFPLIVFLLVAIYLILRYLVKNNNPNDNNNNNNKLKKNKKRKIKNKNVINNDDITNKTDHNSNSELQSIIKNDSQSYYPSVTQLPKLEPDYMGEDNDSIYKLEKEYHEEKKNGNMSDYMLNEIYQDKNKKMSFDELARVISGK
jgi:hypothetical protein